ncbi:MAG: MgtC/SapB family protein [Proteobacteria bacterium]|nr:MgtC/SapB family protein [Pseudomonadota bacterium]
MNVDQLLYRLALALGIGLLVGLERGWKTRGMQPGKRAAGVRTFTLCGLLGGIVAALAQALASPVAAGLVFGFSFAVYAAIFAVMERDADRAAGSFSATTIIAGLLTFMLGAYAVIGDMRMAAAVAVAATAILALRAEIHGWIDHITWPELRSALVLLAMTFIVLPVVPDMTIGGANPREVWLIAIVLAGVSFLGYVAVKVFGSERGVLFAAAAGGLVSSTAVTLTSARRAATGEAAPLVLAAGVAIATAISFLRVMAIAMALQPSLLPLIAPGLVAAALAAAGYAGVTMRWRDGSAGGQGAAGEFSNPLSFWPVVGYALLLGVVIVLGRYIGETFGTNGALAGAAALGFADQDTVAAAMSRLVPAILDSGAASEAILIAVVSNMVSKLGLAIVLGRGRFAGEVAVMTVLCWLAGAAGLWAAVGLGFPVPH